MNQTVKRDLDALSAYLCQRRDEILQLWREAVRRDPEITTKSSLSRRALDDHIPAILEVFERRLGAEHALAAAQIDIEQRKDAADHGMHRWQQGYDIREAMREWGHLQAIVLQQLDRYVTEHPTVALDAMSAARAALAALCMEGNCESASRYARLQQAEAASRARDLETSLGALQALESERAALLRETAHDLRGSVGVIANTTALLVRPEVTSSQRDHFYDLLQDHVSSMSALLADLVELARLEAGQDPPKIETFDAAERIRGYCETLRTIAAERNLFLKCEGPASLQVESDPLKVQRIMQNLLLNSLKATQRGGVVVRWSADTSKEPPRWVLSIQDTGPGFTLQSSAPMRHALKQATDQAHVAEATAADRNGDTEGLQPTDVLPAGSGPGSATPPAGEGIGLSIVKRLCEALGATVELDTAPGRGTTIQITFPLRYSQS
jgi:signal transduction histidine kinase